MPINVWSTAKLRNEILKRNAEYDVVTIIVTLRWASCGLLQRWAGSGCLMALTARYSWIQPLPIKTHARYISNSPRMGASRIWSLTQNFSCVFYIYPNSNPSYWKLVQKEDNCTINQLLRIFNFKDIMKYVSFFLLKLLFCPVILRNIRCSKQQISYKYWKSDFTLPHIYDLSHMDCHFTHSWNEWINWST